MKKVEIFSDVPNELIELMNQIKYSNLTPEQAKTKLKELENFVQTNTAVKQFVTVRTAGKYVQKTVVFNDNVPDDAINLLRRYNFSSIPKIMMPMVKTAVRTQLKKINLL